MFLVICAAWFLNTLSTCFQVSFLVKSFIKLVITEYPAQIYEILYKGLSKKEKCWFLYYLKEAVKINRKEVRTFYYIERLNF